MICALHTVASAVLSETSVWWIRSKRECAETAVATNLLPLTATESICTSVNALDRASPFPVSKHISVGSRFRHFLQYCFFDCSHYFQCRAALIRVSGGLEHLIQKFERVVRQMGQMRNSRAYRVAVGSIFRTGYRYTPNEIKILLLQLTSVLSANWHLNATIPLFKLEADSF